MTKLSAAERRAYDAPFPSAEHERGVRAFPRLVPTDERDPAIAANRAALDELGRWQKPFVTLFGKNDPILGAADGPLQAQIPGARGEPHERFWGGHFVQEDRGDYLASAIVRWMTQRDTGRTYYQRRAPSRAQAVVMRFASVGDGLSLPRSVISRSTAAAPLSSATLSAMSAAVRNLMPSDRAPEL